MALETGPNWSKTIKSLVNTLEAKLLTLMHSTSVNLFHGKKNSSQTNINRTIRVHPKEKSTGSNNRPE
jgi:hypothetical protein